MTFERISVTSSYTKNSRKGMRKGMSYVSSTKPMQVTWKRIQRLVPEDTEQIISVSSTEPRLTRYYSPDEKINESLSGLVTPESLNLSWTTHHYGVRQVCRMSCKANI